MPKTSKAKKPAAAKRGTGSVMDVTHPGVVPPSGTSRSVIVTNRPILQDPMVTPAPGPGAADEPAAPAPPHRSGSSEKVLAVSTAPLLKAATAADEPAPPAGQPKPAHKAAKPPAEPAAAAAAPETEAAAEPAQPPLEPPAVEEESPQPEAAKAETVPERRPATAAAGAKPEPAEPAAAESDDQAPVPAKATAADAAKTPKQQEAAAAAEQAKHDALVQKLADGKQYYLPINMVEKRRTRRFVLLGIVLALLLAVAWVDIALDAGLIHLGGVKPVTHFFSN